MDWLNFHHLRYFWLVAREGSVSRAAKRLHVTQPTVSEQLRQLQDRLGTPLLRRVGRNLELTEAGATVARIANQIFALGDRLVDTLSAPGAELPERIAVGISDAVPKQVAYRILEPAVQARVQTTCTEGSLIRLVTDLRSNALDVVISDSPSHESRTVSQLLGDCGVSVWGGRRLATEMRTGFPRSLDGAPFLLPSHNTGFRPELDAWFAARKIRPRIVGEFHDAALLAVFAEEGAGLCVAPDAIANAGDRSRGLVRAGPIRSLRARYYTITVEGNQHPAVALVAGAARQKLFGTPLRVR